MASSIDATKPADGVIASKSDLRANLSAAKSEIEALQTAVAAGGDATPSVVTSDASPFALATTSRTSYSVTVTSHATAVDFEVPTDATAGSVWRIAPSHDGCLVSVNTGVGSVNGTAGGTAYLSNGGVAYVEVVSNAGSAPVVRALGDVMTPITSVGATTFDKDDHGKTFLVTGNPTFGETNTFPQGFKVTLLGSTGADYTINGATTNHTMVTPGRVEVMRVGDELMAIGHNNSLTILDTYAGWTPVELAGYDASFRNDAIGSQVWTSSPWPGATGAFTIWCKHGDISGAGSYENLVLARRVADNYVGGQMVLQRNGSNAYPRFICKANDETNSWVYPSSFTIYDGSSHYWAIVFDFTNLTIDIWFDGSHLTQHTSIAATSMSLMADTYTYGCQFGYGTTYTTLGGIAFADNTESISDLNSWLAAQ
jgi:hypothetical protein